ncbi:beta strand repeat-containing protein [Pedosphaera parvula]|uniref:Uncharacterized protein n=1 Tax=Pedosphaera parvula (strain Ellin514) TaxID=320771 RepID=B9XKP9_PEDPL|nr:hypothetical protein [Pedosphaera parvula]EEF59542.1 hypothetical protein Cflav_PD2449 [Pedosphaera parvula Ellin514]
MQNVNHSLVVKGNRGRLLWTIALAHLLLTGTVAFAQVNSWTKPTSGAWEEPVWSLGILPNSSQTIEITNAGFKAVGINPSTATGFPGSLTINHLDIFGPANSSNTLLMNFFGTNPPLRVLNGVNVGTNGRILNLFSGLLVVNAGHLAITNGSVQQEGGFVSVGDEIDVDGTYNLTNGLVQTPHLVVGGDNNVGLFTQEGGTNSTSDLVVQADSAPATYDLGGGVLNAGSEEIFSSLTAMGIFNQTGGRNTVTNTLRLAGSAVSSNPFGPSVALYAMNGGQLSVGTLLLNAYSSFAQSNGTTMVSGAVEFNTGSPFFLTTSFLTGGTLAAANVSFSGAGEGLEQTGGTLIVSNLFSFGGFTFEPPIGFAPYDFAGGLLMASNIEILANFSIGSAGGQTRRITNPGFFRLGAGGTVTTATIDEQLGRFILASSAAIDMGAGASKLAFADSSSQTWAAGAILSILNWSGSTNGGGSDQLFFGTNSSGLTLAQLSQIRFVNPAGFPPGSTNFARILSTGEVVPSGTQVVAQVNSWTKPTSGAWEEPVWSLGILPNSSQTIEITNAGFKAVGIFPATATGFPGSLTINHLDIFGPANSSNTLLMNFFGTNPPLRVLNGVNVGTNGRILNLFSGMLVDGGHLGITNGSVQQEGGFVIVGDEIDVEGTYDLTNGLVQTPNILVDGDINVGLFTQDGGTNSTTDLVLRAGSAPAIYDLSGGFLNAGSEEIFSSLTAMATFNQTGGFNTVTNTLRLEGAATDRNPFGPSVALYAMNGGQLSATTLLLDPYSSFAQSNGTTTVSGTVQFNALSPFFRTTSFLAGGTLSAANVSFAGAGENLVQTGGTLVVSNLFSFGGFAFSPPLGFALYDFIGGTLIASNIEILGNFSIDSAGGQTRRITNPGFFRLGSGGTVTTATIDERLGRFILASSAAIDMGAGASKLAFADSSSQTWAAGAILSILNWSGSTNGGGSDQLFFGTNSSGLTLAQLSQIRFVNPAGFPPGSTNFARILSTGEVVPSVQPVLVAMKQGTTMVLQWPAPFKLLTSTNVLGPYLVVPGAVSPYVIDIKSSPKAFFRLMN